MQESTRKLPKTPKAAKATPKVKTPSPPVDPLAGVTIKVEVLTYKPDLHRPRVHIKTPTGAYYRTRATIRTLFTHSAPYRKNEPRGVY